MDVVSRIYANRAEELAELNQQLIMRQLFTVAACRRQGLARHLLSSLQADVYDDKPVRLEVLAGNLDAQAFYKSMGYQLYCHTLIKT